LSLAGYCERNNGCLAMIGNAGQQNATPIIALRGRRGNPAELAAWVQRGCLVVLDKTVRDYPRHFAVIITPSVTLYPTPVST
jgi:hypothetical protein